MRLSKFVSMILVVVAFLGIPFAAPSGAQVLSCTLSLSGPFLSDTTILGIPGKNVSASSSANCNGPSPSLTLVVGVHAVGTGMSGWNPYTRQNASSISGSVSAGMGGPAVCYFADASLTPAGGEPGYVRSPCNIAE